MQLGLFIVARCSSSITLHNRSREKCLYICNGEGGVVVGGAFSSRCHKGSLIIMFMHVNVSQNTPVSPALCQNGQHASWESLEGRCVDVYGGSRVPQSSTHSRPGASTAFTQVLHLLSRERESAAAKMEKLLRGHRKAPPECHPSQL